VFTQTTQFDAMQARADVSRAASACSNASWRRDRSHVAKPAADIAFAAMAIVPVYQGTLGFPATDGKHIGRRLGVASP